MRHLKMLLALVIVAVVTPVTSAGVLLGTFLFLPLPAKVPEPPVLDQSQISRVFDADGNEIGIFRQFETSIPVTPKDIPEVLKQAVIAAEDRNFYEHGGVDLRGTMRALWADIRNRGAVQGGSTITQQLVKNTYTGGERSISRKIREAVLASQLDRQEDKDDILFRYLQVIYLGEGSYGVGAASENYFRKPVSELGASESAMLAGLIPAPSRYSPRVDLDAAEAKRVRILRVMLGEGMLTQKEHDDAAARKLWPAVLGPPPGPATIIYPPETQQTTEPELMDHVRRHLSSRLPGGEQQLQRGGLRIETTLDPRMQRAARDAVAAYLEGTEPDLKLSVVSVEPPTGFVRAIVNGHPTQVNWALGASGGGSGRQPGSSFKPFVLAEAFQQGIAPEKVYSGAVHAPAECGVTPDDPLENYGGGGTGSMPLRNATWRSVNTVFTRLIMDVGVDKVMGTAKRLGLTSLPRYKAGTHCASVALGALDTSPLEMASAYGVFANHGQRVAPTPVLRVYDREGNLLIDNSDREPERVLKTEVADNVTDVLQGVLTSGTAAGRGIERPAAGKTGTTQENKDAWFIGYTPTLSTAVWLGYENAPGTEPKRLPGTTGGTGPARVWQSYMRVALEDVPKTEFDEPAPIVSIADEQMREARGFFDPGQRMYPRGGDGGPYDVGLEPPTAEAPTSTTIPEATTTTTAPPDEVTTTTRRPIVN